MEKVYICGPLTRKRAERVHLEPIIKQYLDYVTEGDSPGQQRQEDKTVLPGNERVPKRVLN
jgi:hypothetical protein